MAICSQEKKVGHSANTGTAFTCIPAMHSVLKEAEILLEMPIENEFQ